MWKALKHNLPSKKRISRTPAEVQPDDFNQFFANIGKKLASNFTNSNSHRIYSTRNNTSKVNFSLIPISFVHKQLNNLPNTKTIDVCGLQNDLLRIASPIISCHLAYIFNLSIQNGEVPPDWKLARVTPLYKGVGQCTEPSNYRPISIVSSVAKIIERWVKSQVMKHATTFNIFSEQQFAYLPNRSTVTALHTIMED